MANYYNFPFCVQEGEYGTAVWKWRPSCTGIPSRTHPAERNHSKCWGYIERGRAMPSCRKSNQVLFRLLNLCGNLSYMHDSSGYYNYCNKPSINGGLHIHSCQCWLQPNFIGQPLLAAIVVLWGVHKFCIAASVYSPITRLCSVCKKYSKWYS